MTLTTGSELALPAQQVEELLRTLVKGLRAFQIYLPNNPIYQRAEQAIKDAFLPIWSSTQGLTFTVAETDLIWNEQVVYHQPVKSESFAWLVYKDGMRVLTLRPGVEDDEVVRFLQTITRARLLAADAGDDLLTLLWEQEFVFIEYQFAEVISDSLAVLDPQAVELAMNEDPAAQTAIQEQVRQDAAARPSLTSLASPLDLEDFDSTLYFLEEQEVFALKRQVDEEYTRDLRHAAFDALLDIFEFQPATVVRSEIIGIFDMLFPNLLGKGEFRRVAALLREFRTVVARTSALEPSHRERLEAFQAQLSEPAILTQLLQFLEEVTVLPDDQDMGEVLGELRPQGLETMLTFLPRLKRPAIRGILERSVDRLARQHLDALLALLGTPGTEALPAALALCGRLQLQAAVPALDALVDQAEPSVRLGAVEALAAIGSAGALTALERALDDAERAVRVVAVTAVTVRAFKGALRRLEAAVTGRAPHELERAEKRQFFEAYAVVAGSPGLGVLADILEPRGLGLFRRRETPETRTCAAYAVARLGTPEARTLLRRVEHDKELSVRNAAIRALREWPEP